MALVTAGPAGLDVNDIDCSLLKSAAVLERTAAEMKFDLGGGRLVTVSGTGFAYDGTGAFSAGEVTGVAETLGGQPVFTVSGLSLAADAFAKVVAEDTGDQGRVRLFDGNDTLIGSTNAPNVLDGFGSSGFGFNSVVGGEANDTITASFGYSKIFANGGDDHIDAKGAVGPGAYIRGGAGADTISCSGGADDVNGNQGNDSINGVWGADTLLGGQGDDVIHGGVGIQAGYCILNGNLGNDTIVALGGSNVLRGGQGDDSIQGAVQVDNIYGDLGADTLTGGQGADVFHFAPGSGHDVITDFHGAEGDRIQLSGVGGYTLAASGADTVLDLGNGDQVTLVGVAPSSLQSGWIVSG